MKNIPNIISCLRIASAPILLYLAYIGLRLPFLVILIMALATDALDGYVARRFDAATNLGAKLDSFGDMAIYFAMPWCAWWLLPQIVYLEAIYVLIAFCGYVLPMLAGLLKFKTFPSYHTWGSKISAHVMAYAIIIVFLTGVTWFFRAAALFQAMVGSECILITLRLPVLQSNVKSLWHVRKQLSKNSA